MIFLGDLTISNALAKPKRMRMTGNRELSYIGLTEFCVTLNDLEKTSDDLSLTRLQVSRLDLKMTFDLD